MTPTTRPKPRRRRKGRIIADAAVLIRNLRGDGRALAMARTMASEGGAWRGASVKRIKALRQQALRRLAKLRRRLAPGGRRKVRGRKAGLVSGASPPPP